MTSTTQRPRRTLYLAAKTIQNQTPLSYVCTVQEATILYTRQREVRNHKTHDDVKQQQEQHKVREKRKREREIESYRELQRATERASE